MMARSWHWIAILPLLALPARAQEAGTPQPQGYAAVMRAQYAARQAPLPAGPDEAQKIYDNYLQSIGKPLKDSSGDSQDDATTTPSR